MLLGDISSAVGVHWTANWDPTPPLLPNIQPLPASLPPSVTEGGSSGSPLYNAEQRLIGVLSGGASFCGVSADGLNDQYGGLFHAWEVTRVLGRPPVGEAAGDGSPSGPPASRSGSRRATTT